MATPLRVRTRVRKRESSTGRPAYKANGATFFQPNGTVNYDALEWDGPRSRETAYDTSIDVDFLDGACLWVDVKPNGDALIMVGDITRRKGRVLSYFNVRQVYADITQEPYQPGICDGRQPNAEPSVHDEHTYYEEVESNWQRKAARVDEKRRAENTAYTYRPADEAAR